jgi:DNA (cytosine-5)-methyltransferase 1
MRVLNLYAGIGGNRKLWHDVDVVAIENDPVLAKIYKTLFPNDLVIVADAHEYLRKYFKEFDFIWSSPPCPTHSSFRQNIGVRYRGVEPKYPDMILYEEILFLQYNATCKWVIENVKPYYKPLIEGKLIQRHMLWSNFEIEEVKFESDKIRTAQIPELQKKYGFNLDNYKIKNKRQVLRNCVEPELGLHIIKCARSDNE